MNIHDILHGILNEDVDDYHSPQPNKDYLLIDGFVSFDKLVKIGEAVKKHLEESE